MALSQFIDQKQSMCAAVCANACKRWKKTYSKFKSLKTNAKADCNTTCPFCQSIKDKYHHKLLDKALKIFIQFVLRTLIERIHHLCKYSKPFRFLLFYLYCGAVFALPKLCSEPEPIDLLARAISGSGSVPTGVEVVSDVNNIKGYRFDPTARLFGVDSEEIFPICNRFPTEFSIIITFLHPMYRKTNEFIMTLLAQDRNTILLSVKLQDNRLVFDYAKSPTDERTSASINRPTISDGKWHTVVITVSSNHVTFTLDCEPPFKRKMDPGFPKNLNIKNTKIHIGSRRKRRKMFTGLLRQLILLPGADAATRICPSDNPSLATLDQGYGKPAVKTSPGIIFEDDIGKESCSVQNKGTLLFTQENTLQVCTGEAFKPVKGGYERMDYVIDYEDIITDNFTVSIEQFRIPGEGLFIATANNDDFRENNSIIFKWDGKKFKLYQRIKTYAAIMWKFFEIDFSYYLVVANSDPPAGKNASSTIYRWSERRKKFLPARTQILDSFGVRSIEFFAFGGYQFLFVAYHHELGKEPSSSNGPSKIYRWNADSSKFEFYQWIPTQAALDVTYFQIALNPRFVFNCFVVANSFDGQTSRVLSEIYCWEFFVNNQRFQKVQSIETVGAADWEFFQFDGRYFLAVANSFEKLPNAEPTRILNSSIYELNLRDIKFVRYQVIETYGANDWEFFKIGKQYFLIVSNTVSNFSQIYRWQGIEQFVKVHSLPVNPCSDFDYIQIDGEHYLAYANPNENLSKLYKIVTY